MSSATFFGGDGVLLSGDALALRRAEAAAVAQRRSLLLRPSQQRAEPAGRIQLFTTTAAAATRASRLTLAFADCGLEASFRQWTFARFLTPARVASVCLVVPLLLGAILYTAGGGGGDLSGLLALLWVNVCLRAAYAVFLCAGMRAGATPACWYVRWWSPLAAAVSTAAPMLLLAFIWVCGALDSGNCELQSLDYTHSPAPAQFFVIALTAPLLERWLYGCDAFHVLLSTVAVVALAVVALTVGVDVPASSIALVVFIVFINAANVVCAYLMEAGDRLIFLSHAQLQRTGERFARDGEEKTDIAGDLYACLTLSNQLVFLASAVAATAPPP